MTETQIEEAERILSYTEAHPDNDRAQMFVRDDAVRLLRDLLPDWSAFKTPEVTP
jgi:hypothetical protein